MLFNSLAFLYFFLPITYWVFWKLEDKNQRYIWLTISGYVFYGAWNYKFCFLMAFSTIVSYLAGLGFLRWNDQRHRKLCLVLPVVCDLLLLGFFKYANFTLANAGWFASIMGSHWRPPHFDIVLPVGISFYTFHTITYIVDSYRGVIKPTRNFFEFSCYVSLFSQLVAGPIVRFRQVESDLENLDHASRHTYMERGWSFFVIGMVKKVLVADTIAAIINPALTHWQTLTTGDAWLCALGYTYQLYFDFSGYSDMAVGLGYLFGIRLPQNFDTPYKAVSPSDFWRRWHISLSTVLRDYLYIPLGGSRKGTFSTYRNLMITMLLGGLWHGASWTFVAWGVYHGMWLCFNRLFENEWQRFPKKVAQCFTFLVVVIGWVLFRADSFEMARTQLHAMLTWTAGANIQQWPFLLGFIAIAGACAHFGPNTFELRYNWRPRTSIAVAALFVLCIGVIYGGQQSPFLYFQF